jgi:hypothetical protein
LQLLAGGSEKMRITSAGNVGIGTTNPSEKLHVKQASSNASITIEGNTNSGALFSSRLNFSNKDISGNDIDFTIGLKKSNDFVFLGDAAANELMRIEGNTGNVGIGTSSPASKLEVDGGDIEVDDSASGLILRSPNGTRYRIQVDNSGNLTTTAI